LSYCAIVRSNVLENFVEYKRIILRQACQITIYLILILNRNARNSMHYFDINFYFSIDLFSICTTLTMLYCSWINNNISSTISICYSIISIDIINFDLIRVAYFFNITYKQLALESLIYFKSYAVRVYRIYIFEKC